MEILARCGVKWLASSSKWAWEVLFIFLRRKGKGERGGPLCPNATCARLETEGRANETICREWEEEEEEEEEEDGAAAAAHEGRGM